MKVKLGIILLILLCLTGFAQTDWTIWDKAQPDYTIQNNFRYRNYSFDSENTGEFLSRSFINAYWFFISDVDGDNCPFRPSCSAFFAESVKEADVFQASLMFFDRFTRDMNVYKRKNHYPHVKSGYYYDPPKLYTLNNKKIEFIPSSTIVDDK